MGLFILVKVNSFVRKLQRSSAIKDIASNVLFLNYLFGNNFHLREFSVFCNYFNQIETDS